jgi:hypothetical protein
MDQRHNYQCHEDVVIYTVFLVQTALSKDLGINRFVHILCYMHIILKFFSNIYLLEGNEMEKLRISETSEIHSQDTKNRI